MARTERESDNTRRKMADLLVLPRQAKSLQNGAGFSGKATEFKQAACCPSAVVQKTAQRKNGLCESARGNWDSRESQQPFRPNPNGDRNTALRRRLIGADIVKLAPGFCV